MQFGHGFSPSCVTGLGATALLVVCSASSVLGATLCVGPSETYTTIQAGSGRRPARRYGHRPGWSLPGYGTHVCDIKILALICETHRRSPEGRQA